MAVMNVGGRPPKYTTKEQIEGLIEQYFKDCEGEILKDSETGAVIFDRSGQPIYLNRRPLTITGLALALGFNSRQSLLNYQGKKEFKATIDRAKARVEQYTEERLFDKDGANGAKFSLQNNFRGWNSSDGSDSRGPAINIICDIPNPPKVLEVHPVSGQENQDGTGKD